MENNPELKEAIMAQMADLEKHNSPMPVIHITNRAIEHNGSEISTGFVENIKEKGFRKKDTNVGVFIKRAAKTSIAEPSFLKIIRKNLSKL